MTKKELIRAVAIDASLTQEEVRRVLDLSITMILCTVGNGENVVLGPLGTFATMFRARRVYTLGRRTGTIFAHSVPKFKPTSEFKRMVKRRSL